MVHFYDAVQDEFRDHRTGRNHHLTAETDHGAVRLGILHHQAEILRPRSGDRHGQDRKMGRRDHANLSPILAVVAGGQIVPILGRIVSPDAAPRVSSDRDGPDEFGTVERILDPGIAVRSDRKFSGIGIIAVREVFHGEPAARRRYAGSHFLHRKFCFRKPDSHRNQVFVPGEDRAIPSRNILILTRCGKQFRQPDDLQAGSGDLDRTPGKFLHRIRRFHPGTARGTPSRCGCHRRLHSLRFRQVHGILQRHFPVRTPIGHLLRHDLPDSDSARIELVETADTGTFHPVEIGPDPFHRHIPVHPMPPDPRPRRLWRILELLIQRLGLRPFQHGGCHQQPGQQHLLHNGQISGKRRRWAK